MENPGRVAISVLIMLSLVLAGLPLLQFVPTVSAQTPTIPSGIVAYVPITVTNAQSAATSAPFQQMIATNSATYTSYEASNLTNVEFFGADGSVIPSWLESGASNTATNTIYWLELQNGIPAGSGITIYMGFATIGTNLLNSQNTGEAPQLSSSYGQFDDGSNIFNMYESFRGTSLSGVWSTVNYDTTITVNNGLTLNGPGLPRGDAGGIITTSTFGYPQYVDYDLQSYSNSEGSPSVDIETSTSGDYGHNPTPGSWCCGFDSGYGILQGSPTHADMQYWSSSGINGKIGTTMNSITLPSVLSFAWVSTGRESALVNYAGGTSSTNSSNSIGNYHVDIFVSGTYSVSATIQWLRLRAFPPNGVMPVFAFGSLTSLTSSTTTTLNCSPSTVGVGTSATCTASVAGSTPTGTISFAQSSSNGGAVAFASLSCPLSSGGCGVSVTGSSIGIITITATYSGDSKNQGSTNSYALAVTGKTSTQTGATCSSSSVTVGSAVTCTATVTGTSPTGSIAWSQSGSGGGSVTFSSPTCNLSGGNCQVTVTGASASTVMVTATYSGDPNNQGSSGTTTVTVIKASSSTSVSCSPNPVTVGSSTTCTSSVTGYSAPTGTVTFSTSSPTGSFSPSATCTLSGGGCSASYSDSKAGTIQITATYAGDSNYQGSTSNSYSLTVSIQTKGSSQTVISCSPNPVVVGQATKCIATVSSSSGSTPTGTAAFTTSSSTGSFSPSATCTLSSGSCSVSYSDSSAGGVQITGTYGGDSSNQGSTSNPYGLTVSKASSQTNAICSSSSVMAGSVITCTATVAGFSPTGSITWSQSSSNGGSVAFSPSTCNLSGGSCQATVTGVSGGIVTITATYGGDSSNQASAASATVSVTAPTGKLSVSILQGVTVIDVGQTDIFTASTSGGQRPYSYQWLVNNQVQSGQTGSSFVFQPSSPASYTVQVQVSDGANPPGTASSNQLSVAVNSQLVAPTISASLSILQQDQSSSLTSSTVNTGTSPYSYQWYQEIPGASSFTAISGATSSSFSFSPSSPTQTGQWIFILSVTDQVGESATSNSITIQVKPTTGSPAITLSSSSGVIGSTFRLSGTGFAPSSVITASFDGTILAASSPVATDSSGAFTTIYAVPISTSGTHVVTAKDASANSASQQYTVIKSPTYTGVTCSPSSTIVGTSTQCVVVVTDTNPQLPITPTGSVLFTAAPSNIGNFDSSSCVLQPTSVIGAAQCSVHYTPTTVPSNPVVTITATYEGDSYHSGSPGTTDLGISQRTSKAATSTNISCRSSSVNVGSTVTCTATISGGSNPSGTVSWSQTSTTGGSVSFQSTICNMVSATCSVTVIGASAGLVVITGVYSGDSLNQASGGTFVLTVGTQAKTPTNTTVSCTSASTAGSPVACAASVTGNSPSGNVAWSTTSTSGSFSSKTCILLSSSCSVTYTDTNGVSTTILAVYQGDSSNSASSGSAQVNFQLAVSLMESRVLYQSIFYVVDLTVPASNYQDVMAAAQGSSSFYPNLNLAQLTEVFYLSRYLTRGPTDSPVWKVTITHDGQRVSNQATEIHILDGLLVYAYLVSNIGSSSSISNSNSQSQQWSSTYQQGALGANAGVIAANLVNLATVLGPIAKALAGIYGGTTSEQVTNTVALVTSLLEGRETLSETYGQQKSDAILGILIADNLVPSADYNPTTLYQVFTSNPAAAKNAISEIQSKVFGLTLTSDAQTVISKFMDSLPSVVLGDFLIGGVMGLTAYFGAGLTASASLATGASAAFESFASEDLPLAAATAITLSYTLPEANALYGAWKDEGYIGTFYEQLALGGSNIANPSFTAGSFDLNDLNGLASVYGMLYLTEFIYNANAYAYDSGLISVSQSQLDGLKAQAQAALAVAQDWQSTLQQAQLDASTLVETSSGGGSFSFVSHAQIGHFSGIMSDGGLIARSFVLDWFPMLPSIP